jgi:hypothetical protein
MRIGSLHSLGRYDCLFVSPHAGDSLLSCIGRMLWERNRGMRVLVLVVFAGHSDDSHADEALDRLGFDEMRLDVPAAPRRHETYSSFAAVLHGQHASDDRQLLSLREDLDHVLMHCQARHVYFPLGVGGHVDHRLVHEAGYQAMPEAPGREVFFYEDRPYAFLPGAVWLRLGQLGARLPPAASLSERTGLVQYLLRFQMSSYLRSHARSAGDRFWCSRAALRQWFDARGWHPRRAVGPRFQPVEHPLDAPALEVARELLAWHAARLSLCTSAPRVRPAHPAAVPRLKRRDENERYWLLLPSLEGDRTLPGMGLGGGEVRPAVTAS